MTQPPQEVPELPPLPDPWNTIDGELWGQNTTFEVYTADQMRAYAREALTQAVADAQRYRALRDSGRYSPSNFGPGWALCTGYDKDRHSPERRRELDASADLQIQGNDHG